MGKTKDKLRNNCCLFIQQKTGGKVNAIGFVNYIESNSK
jgi:hypothetical protein